MSLKPQSGWVDSALCTQSVLRTSASRGVPAMTVVRERARKARLGVTMQATRTSGLLLMLVAALVFVAINFESLPANFFPLGMLLFPVGLYVFTKANRVALTAAEARAAAAVNPTIRSTTADAHAANQQRSIAQHGAVDSQLRAPRAVGDSATTANVPLSSAGSMQSIDVEHTDDRSEVALSSDVSYPVELQESTKVADEIRKLQRLLEDGIIDAQEFSAAKAKLLG
jgi:uncharacterized integral membrane protein